MTDDVLSRTATFLHDHWDQPPADWPSKYRSTPQFPKTWAGVRFPLAIQSAQGLAPGLSLYAFIEWREAKDAAARLREQLTLVASDTTGRTRRDPYTYVAEMSDPHAAEDFLKATVDRFGEPWLPPLTLRPGISNTPSSERASKRARVIMLSLATLHHLSDEPLGAMLSQVASALGADLGNVNDWDLLAWSDDQIALRGWPSLLRPTVRDRYKEVAVAFTENWRDHRVTAFLSFLGGASIGITTDDEFLTRAAARPIPFGV